MDDMDGGLDQVRQAIANGDRETGRRLLASLLHADPKNAAAWLLLSQVVESEQQRADCLRRAAALDPANRLAGKRVERGTVPAAEGPGILEQPAPLPVRPAPRPPYPADEQLRRRGYRNVMLAGALAFTLLLGLVLLMVVASTILPRARKGRGPAGEPVLYTAALWCPPCAQAGTPIVLWENAGEGAVRGAKTGELPHGTTVSVLAESWSQVEGRTYCRVAGGGQQGWVLESFLSKPGGSTPGPVLPESE